MFSPSLTLTRLLLSKRRAKFRDHCTWDQKMPYDAHSQMGWSLPGQSTAFLIFFRCAQSQSIITSALSLLPLLYSIFVLTVRLQARLISLTIYLDAVALFSLPSTYNMTERALCSENEWSDPERKSRKINLPPFLSLTFFLYVCLSLTQTRRYGDE